MPTKRVVHSVVHDQWVQRLAVQRSNVIRLEVDIEGDFPVGLQCPRVTCHNLMSGVSIALEVRSDVGVGGYRIDIVGQANNQQAGNACDR